MKRSIAPVLAVGAILLLGSFDTPARAATTILHNFTGGASDGQNPAGSLTLSGSKLYGMTQLGGVGTNRPGTIFSMNTDGTGFALLHSFTGGATDGSTPLGSLTLSGSKLYGMTQVGGSNGDGTVFSMNTDGTGFSVLHSFKAGPSTDGGWPYGSLTLSGSKLFGLTSLGGSTGNGAVFTMNTDGTGFGLLHNFTGAPNDGWNPHGDLTLAGSKLYGMTLFGGNGSGTIFSMNTDGTGYIVLHSFTGGASDGRGPYGSLTLLGSTLYGMTEFGGSQNNHGTLFRMDTDGTGFSLLHSFAGGINDGLNPRSSLTLSGSTLYGMTLGGGAGGGGVLFSIGTDGSGFGLLESFGTASAGGRGPLGDLTLSDDGSTFYGMTSSGGTASEGVIFSRAIPEPGAFVLLGLGATLLSARRRNTRA